MSTSEDSVGEAREEAAIAFAAELFDRHIHRESPVQALAMKRLTSFLVLGLKETAEELDRPELAEAAEKIKDVAESDTISAIELVDAMAHAGPGSRLLVEAQHIPSGNRHIGKTTWHTDMIGGPAVMFYEREDDPAYVTSVIPLGGQTVFMKPPKVDSMSNTNGRHAAQMGSAPPMRVPVDPITQENFRFQLVPTQD